MSHVANTANWPVGNAGGFGGSGLASEKNASSSASPTPTAIAAPKLRSCILCRSRKVRCDKLSPCSNCRRANIACVLPSNDRPPRWARRLDRVTKAAPPLKSSQDADSEARDSRVGHVMDRLRNLESLVKELSGQLEQANAAASSTAGSSSSVNSPESSAYERDENRQTSTSSTAGTTNVQKQFGRLVLQDPKQSRYISSGFWSRVNDELDGLKMDTQGLASGSSDTSEDEDFPGKTPPTQELERTPLERHAFIFRHNLGTSIPDLREFNPLPSQIPFLLNVYSENVNFFVQVVHMPSVTKMVHELRGTDKSSLTPSNEALMFSIYYAAVTSMEEEDVMTNFGFTKAELNLKYRLGLEYALAKANFLNVPDLVLVQAFAIFLFLVRRHDSPRFVWMMTGIVIRMAQALGLHRDGSHFQHLSPFEVEVRRRVWWALCMLDIRASEDQGTDFTITSGSFDTKFPLNIDDAEIDPETKETPTARHAITDVTVALISFETCEIIRQMMAPGLKGSRPNLEDQSRLLNEIYEKLERGYLQYSTESGNIAYWVAVTATRLVMSKLTLFIYLPVLLPSPNEHFSDAIRNKLLVAAIEVAEYNHALNSEQACRQWRWIFQTYTHWYATIYLLIEVARRQWSPFVERAWIALHSRWLIPAQPDVDKNLLIWVPLRKLMAKARKHRETELERLRGDAWAVEQLEMGDRNVPIPASSGPFPTSDNSGELFRKYWRSLVSTPVEPSDRMQPSRTPEKGSSHSSIVTQNVDVSHQQDLSSAPIDGQHDMWGNPSFEPVYQAVKGSQVNRGQGPSSTTTADSNPTATTNSQNELSLEQTQSSSYNTFFSVPADWSIGPGFTPWLWADADPRVDVFAGVDVNMNIDSEIEWYNWLESTKNIDWNPGPASGN